MAPEIRLAARTARATTSLGIPMRRVRRIDRVDQLRDAMGVETHVGQQAPVRHRQERGLVVRLDKNDEHIIFILRDPILRVGGQDVPVSGSLLVHGEARAARQVQGVHRDRLHGVQCKDIVKGDVGALRDTTQFIPVLRVALLHKRQILARLDLGAFPGKLELIVRLIDQFPGIGYAVADLLTPRLTHLPADLAVSALQFDQWGRGGVNRGVGNFNSGEHAASQMKICGLEWNARGRRL